MLSEGYRIQTTDIESRCMYNWIGPKFLDQLWSTGRSRNKGSTMCSLTSLYGIKTPGISLHVHRNYVYRSMNSAEVCVIHVCPCVPWSDVYTNCKGLPCG